MGVVTLLLACIFIAGWVRSQFKLDWIRIRTSQSHVHVFSSNTSELIWYSRREPWNRPIFGTMQSVPDVWKEGFTIEWHWEMFGFHALKGAGIQLKIPTSMWIVPYWSIVISLTLVSVYLLLNKP